MVLKRCFAASTRLTSTARARLAPLASAGVVAVLLLVPPPLTAHELVFDAVTGTFCPFAPPRGFIYEDDEVQLKIVRADWETSYAIQLANATVNVARPQSFGEALSAADFPNLGELFSQGGLSTGTGTTVAAPKAELTLEDVVALQEKAVGSLRALLGAKQAMDRVRTAELTPLEQAVAAAEADVDAALAAVTASTTYPMHSASRAGIEKAVATFNRAAALATALGDQATEWGNVLAAGSLTLGELRQAGASLQGVDAKQALRQILSAQATSVEGRATQFDSKLDAAFNLIPQFEQRLQEAEGAAAALRTKATDLHARMVLVESKLRGTVATFNGRYAEKRAEWTAAGAALPCGQAAPGNTRTITADLVVPHGRTETTVKVFGKAEPVQVTLTFAKKVTGSGEEAPQAASAGTGGGGGQVAAVLAEAPSGFSLLGTKVYDVHVLHHFQFAAGLALSQVDDLAYGLIKRTVTEVGDDGTETAVAKQEVVRKRDHSRQLEPLFEVIIHPRGKDLDAAAYTGRARWVPGLLMGFSLADPTDHLFLGVAFEPRAGFTFSVGQHWAKQPRLLDGFTEGQLLGEKDTLPVDEKLEDGIFFAVGIDSSVFGNIFRSLLGAS